MHELVISPFLDTHLVLRPGCRNAVKISWARYAQLRTAGPAGPCPGWLADAAQQAWGIDVSGCPLGAAAVVRSPSLLRYARASHELNMGCNYDFFWIKQHHSKWLRIGHHGPTYSSAEASPSACARRAALGSVNRTGFPCSTA